MERKIVREDGVFFNNKGLLNSYMCYLYKRSDFEYNAVRRAKCLRAPVLPEEVPADGGCEIPEKTEATLWALGL